MNKKSLSERDICTKFINPSIEKTGWDIRKQVREEVSFTDGRIIVQGELNAPGKRKRADYILNFKPKLAFVIIESKDNKHPVGDGMQQALEYSKILNIPFVFTSNGDSFVFHEKTLKVGKIEKEIHLDNFLYTNELWSKYLNETGVDTLNAKNIVEQECYVGTNGMSPRYYQQNAINRTIEAVAKGQNKVLLVMATGTGKTYTAFNIIRRLWKDSVKKRILFLVDKNALLTQTKNGEFYIVSPVCNKTQIEPKITAQTHHANLSGSNLRKILIPFPSLLEQSAVNEKVNTLMALCDKLEQQI